MANSTCLMHHSFSYTKPPFSNDMHEETPMYGIGESISFGRYVSEELEWEKWSSFDNNNNRNRYVKEAEKYSKPGSVAQKKAYFEAHFKRMAALKAAALLEQSNVKAAKNGSSDDLVDPSSNLVEVNCMDFEQSKMNEREGEKCGETEECVVLQNEVYLTYVVDDQNNVNENEGKDVDLKVGNQKLSDKIEVYSASLKVDDFKASNDETPLLQENSSAKIETSAVTAATKKNPPLPMYTLPEVNGNEQTIACSRTPAKSSNLTHPGKENYATPVKKKSSVTDPDKKRTPLRMSINREFNRIISPVIKKLGNSSKASTPAKVSVSTPQHPFMNPEMRRGASPSSRTGRSKISSPIIPNTFCLNGERTERRKQKLEDKFNAATAEKPPQPSKFKIKAEAELNKFRQSFCFKTMSSPDYYGENGTFRSPKQKNESTHQNSLDGGGRESNRTRSSQNISSLPPRKLALNQKIGLKTKITTPS